MLTTHTPTAKASLLAAAFLVISACSALPFSIGPSGIVPASTPAPLSRCDAAPAALCLITFGFQEPDQMLIEFYVPPGSPFDFYAKVIYKERPSVASCELALDSLTTVYCTSALLPLGATLGLEVYASKTNVMLAKGSFVLSALELPTQVIGGTAGPPPGASPGETLPPPPIPTTGFASSTPTVGSLFSTVTPRGTGAASPTATPPQTAYPNQ